jgi:hypothetical protein
MRSISKCLPSPAMIVACAALIVALGGVSYAATVLPKNSVGAAQLQKKAVSGSKLRKGAVTGAKVKNGSLLGADFKSGQLPSGARGPQGPQGVPGAGVRAYAQVNASGPALIPARTKNFKSVKRVGPGRYCLTPAAGIDPTKVSAVVSPEHSFSSGSDLEAYTEQPKAACAANEFEVFTQQAGFDSNLVAFTILVP